MQELISGKLFEAKKKMTDNFMVSRAVRGGSRKVEQAMKQILGPSDPCSSSVSLFVRPKWQSERR